MTGIIGTSGSRRTRLTALALAAGSLLGVAASAPEVKAAEALVGVNRAGQLVTLNSDRPQRARARALTGLPAGERIVGLDIRPLGQQVMALTSASRLYTVDVNGGSVTAIGTAAFTPPLSGSSVGFDFNPTVDRIRVVTNTGQNLRLNPDTGAVAAIDGQLSYGLTPRLAGSGPAVVASAYTSSFLGSTSTQLFGIDTAADTLVLQNPPNAGTLNTVGPLGVNAASPVAFDIGGTGSVAYAAIRVAGTRVSVLHQIDVATGAARAVGPIRGPQLTAVAVRGTIP